MRSLIEHKHALGGQSILVVLANQRVTKILVRPIVARARAAMEHSHTSWVRHELMRMDSNLGGFGLSHMCKNSEEPGSEKQNRLQLIKAWVS